MLRFHQIILDFFPYFLEGSNVYIVEAFQNASTLEERKLLLSTSARIQESWRLYSGYLNYLGERSLYFFPLRWLLLFFFSAWLSLGPGLENFVSIQGGALIATFSYTRTYVLSPARTQNFYHGRGFATQAFSVSPRVQGKLERLSHQDFCSGHMVYADDKTYFIDAFKNVYLFVQGEARTSQSQGKVISKNLNIQGKKAPQSVLPFHSGEVMVNLKYLTLVPNVLLTYPQIQYAIEKIFKNFPKHIKNPTNHRGSGSTGEIS